MRRKPIYECGRSDCPGTSTGHFKASCPSLPKEHAARILDAEIVSKLSGIVDIPGLLERIHAGTYERADLVAPLRLALFSVFENHGTAGSETPFARWSSEKNLFEHEKTCKRGKATWIVTDKVITTAEAAAGDLRWFVLREMQRRADHLNEHTMPALKVGGHASILTARSHIGTCSKCDSVAVASSVAVEIMWNVLSMRREYRL